MSTVPGPVTQAPDKHRRWIKVDVAPEVFDDLHLKAAESRMRIQPYLRKYLSEAQPYPVPDNAAAFRTFSSGPDQNT